MVLVKSMIDIEIILKDIFSSISAFIKYFFLQIYKYFKCQSSYLLLFYSKLNLSLICKFLFLEFLKLGIIRTGKCCEEMKTCSV